MDIKTYEQWRELRINFTKYVDVGDLVDEEMADFFVSTVFPTTYNEDLIQCGEEYDVGYDEETGEEGYTYFTFKREGEHWRYCGTCMKGRTEETY